MIAAGISLLHYRPSKSSARVGWRGLARERLDGSVAMSRSEILPAEFATIRSGWRARARGEGVGALNHSNIAAIYGIHEANASASSRWSWSPAKDVAERLKAGVSVFPGDGGLRGRSRRRGAAHDQGSFTAISNPQTSG